ncbi:MAG TPA: four helix bundle protein, partial [Bacteroidales bacterium]|nr:four helix bundle protein [Bacteroidales bacterium]
MAQYDTLPVYKLSYDLLLLVFAHCRQMTKEYKYTLGEKLKNETLELIMNIYRA